MPRSPSRQQASAFARENVAFSPVTIPGGTLPMTAELFQPPSTTPVGLVVIAYGTDGRNDPWARYDARLRRGLGEGRLVCFDACLFAGTATLHGGGAAGQIAEKHESGAAALVDSVAFARTQASVDASRIGMLGFS